MHADDNFVVKLIIRHLEINFLSEMTKFVTFGSKTYAITLTSGNTTAGTHVICRISLPIKTPKC